MMAGLRLPARALAAGLGLAAAIAFAAEIERTGGPYVPTPQVVVDQMLRMANVGPGDFVVDLGSGDGVIVLTAARRFKARGFGVEIDPELVKLSNNEAKRLGIADLAQFQVQDVFKADLSKATVVTLYLLPEMMANLQQKILRELKPGTRVVSHDYHFGEWSPDSQITWDVPEKEKVNGVPRATVYLWTVPARIAGRWQVRVAAPAGSEQYEMTLRQSYQNFEGAVTSSAGKLAQARLQGEEISFALPLGVGRHLFRGRVSGDAMEGSVELAGGKGMARWSATRIKS
jgi:phospholipid N-methyltransferase